MNHKKYHRRHKGRGQKKQSSNPSLVSLRLNKRAKKGIRNYAREEGVGLKRLSDLARLGTHTLSSLPGIGHETIVKLQLCAADYNIPWTHSELELKVQAVDADFFQTLLMANLSPVFTTEDEGGGESDWQTLIAMPNMSGDLDPIPTFP